MIFDISAICFNWVFKINSSHACEETLRPLLVPGLFCIKKKKKRVVVLMRAERKQFDGNYVAELHQEGFTAGLHGEVVIRLWSRCTGGQVGYVVVLTPAG